MPPPQSPQRRCRDGVCQVELLMHARILSLPRAYWAQPLSLWLPLLGSHPPTSQSATNPLPTAPLKHAFAPLHTNARLPFSAWCVRALPHHHFRRGRQLAVLATQRPAAPTSPALLLVERCVYASTFSVCRHASTLPLRARTCQSHPSLPPGASAPCCAPTRPSRRGPTHPLPPRAQALWAPPTPPPTPHTRTPPHAGGERALLRARPCRCCHPIHH